MVVILTSVSCLVDPVDRQYQCHVAARCPQLNNSVQYRNQGVDWIFIIALGTWMLLNCYPK